MSHRKGEVRYHARILPRAFAFSRGHTVHRGDIVYRVFCFADAACAERFCERFGRERFDPKDRGRSSAWFLWRKS
jgi:hypothetical protein